MKRKTKFLVTIIAMILALGQCFTVAAAPVTVSTVSSIAVKQKAGVDAKGNAKYKNASKVVIYTNGAEEEKTLTVEYTWKKNGNEDKHTGINVASSNYAVAGLNVARGQQIKGEVVKESKNNVTMRAEVALKAVANGKATITFSSLDGKKKKAVSVEVKTYAEQDDLKAVDKLSVAIGGKAKIGAFIDNAEVSDKALTYAVTSNTQKKAVKVNAKTGEITVANAKSVTAGETAEITVTAKGSKNQKVTAKVQVNIVPAVSTKLQLIQDTTAVTDTEGKLNKKNVVALKGNTSDAAHTYQLVVKDVTAADLVYSVNKEAVASVDENGVITAKGNGTAVVTISHRFDSKKSVKATVKVSTDLESFYVAEKELKVIANNKQAVKIQPVMNENASNQKVEYVLESVRTADGKMLTNPKETKAYVTVDKKGTVKAKKSCTAYVTAVANANKEMRATVTVKAVTPVSKLAIESDTAGYTVVKNKVDFYRTGSAQELQLVAVANEDADDSSVTWSVTPAKNVSLDKETGYAEFYANGKYVFTAKANDGSNKTAKVTVQVKTDAYEIHVAEEEIVVEANAKGITVNLAKTVAAKTNADASDKAVVYYETDAQGNKIGGEDARAISSMKLMPSTDETDNAKYVVAYAKDVRAKNLVKTDVIKLEAFDSALICKDYTIALTDKSDKPIRAGEAFVYDGAIEISQAADATGNKLLNLPVKWKSNNTAVAAVDSDGKITAKKPGMAVISASIQYKNAAGKNVTKEDSFKVYVGNSQAALENNVNKSITTIINAENRDYTGIHTSYNAKAASFDLNILNQNQTISELKDTGLVMALKGLVKEYNAKHIEISEAGIVYSATLDGMNVILGKTGEESKTFAVSDVEEAINYVLEEYMSQYQTWKDCIGHTAAITVTGMEKPLQPAAIAGQEFAYTLAYTVYFDLDNALYSQYIDEKAAVVESLVLTGIRNVDYNAGNIYVELYDADQDIAKADAADRASVVKALEGIFEDASKVVVNVETPVGRDTITKTRTAENSTEEFINATLDEYVAKVCGKVTNYGELNGSKAMAEVTYQVGISTFTKKFTLSFDMGMAGFDHRADLAILNAIEESYAFGSVTYNQDTNELVVKINQDYAAKAPEALRGMGLEKAFKEMVESQNVKEAVVRMFDRTTTVTSAEEILTALAFNQNVKDLADLNGHAADLKVTYQLAKGSKTLTYRISFSVDAPLPTEGDVSGGDVSDGDLSGGDVSGN